MSTATLPQLQVVLDNAHSFSAPTPPNSASTNSSDSPDSAKILTPRTKSSKRLVNSCSPTSLSPRTASPVANSTTTPTTTAITGQETEPSSPLSLIKPPPTPRPWSWQCHRCYTEYKVACTRRCFECGHEFCTASNNASKRGPCRSLFDFAGWEAWGSFRRTIAHLGSHGDGQGQDLGSGDADYKNKNTKRRRKGGVPEESLDMDNTFATWTPATEVIHDLRRGWVSSIIKTDDNATCMPWTAVTAEERERVTRKKEKMYVRQEYNCWLHCDAPSECRLAVYTACFEGRARLVGNSKLTAVLLEDLTSKKKEKKKTRKQKVKKNAAKLVSRLIDSSDEHSDDESGSEEEESDKECVIMRKLRKKKNKLLYGGSSSSTRERRPSTEIITEHVEDRQAEYELPTVGMLKPETTEREERTTSVPREVVWPSSGLGPSAAESTKPGGLLATLINGSEDETDLGSLPYEQDHNDDEAQVPDADFAELVRVSSNLARSSGHISSTSSSAATLVSCPTPSSTPTGFHIIRIDDADHLSPTGPEPKDNGTAFHAPQPIHQPAEQTKGFVDLKEVIDIRSIEERAKRRKRQRSEPSRTTHGDPDDILSPSPQGNVAFRFPIWKDEDGTDSTGEDINNIVSEYSAADLMDILDERSSESQSSSGSNSSSGASSPSPASTAEDGNNMEASTSTSNDMDMTVTTSLFEDANGSSISPLSPSSQEYPPFSPVSPLDPESKLNNDLSMYLDDEIISPVSIAAARSLTSLAHVAASRSYAQYSDDHKASDGPDNDNDSQDDILIGQEKNDTDNRDSNSTKNNQCEVLLTLRKMQSAFMGGRQQGRHW
ncbi:hypothetical protein V8F20_005638 [Naviculisporaceae sp. PSN 640]